MILSLVSTLSVVGTQEKFEASCVLLGYHENSVWLPRVALLARMSGVWVPKRVHCARTNCGRTRKERQQPPTQRVEGDAATDLVRDFIALL